MAYDYDYWLKKQWALEESREQLRAYNASRSLRPSYVFNQDIDKRIDSLSDKTRELDSYISKRMNEIRTYPFVARTNSRDRPLSTEEIKEVEYSETTSDHSQNIGTATKDNRRPIVSFLDCLDLDWIGLGSCIFASRFLASKTIAGLFVLLLFILDFRVLYSLDTLHAYRHIEISPTRSNYFFTMIFCTSAPNFRCFANTSKVSRII